MDKEIKDAEKFKMVSGCPEVSRGIRVSPKAIGKEEGVASFGYDSPSKTLQLEVRMV